MSRIPLPLAREADLHDGSEINMVSANVKILLERERKYRLDDFIAGITEENIHEEVKTGRCNGKEYFWCLSGFVSNELHRHTIAAKILS